MSQPSLIKDTMVYGLSDLIFKFIAFAVFPIYTLYLSPEDFGMMELVIVLAGLVAIVANLGINHGVMRHYYEEEKQANLVSSGIYMLTAAMILLTGLTLGILYLFSERLEAEMNISYEIIVLALVASIASTLLSFVHNVIRLHFAPWKYALLNLLRYSLSVGLILLLIIFYEKGVVGYFLGSLVASWAVLPLALWLINKDLRPKFDVPLAKKVLNFGYPFVFSGLAYWLFGSLDRWMLASLSTITEVGLYSVAFKFATIILFVYQAFGSAWSPHAYKLYQDNPDYKKIFATVLDQWFYILIIVGSMLSLFSIDILRLLTPETYWGAANALGIVVMGIVVYGTTQITMVGMSLEKKTRLIAIGSWIVTLLNISLNLLLIPIYGAVGAGIATLASYVFMTLFYLYWTQKLHRLPINGFRFSTGFLTLFAVLGVSAYYNQQDLNWINLGIKMGSLLGVMIIPILLGIFHIKDLKQIWALLTSPLTKQDQNEP